MTDFPHGGSAQIWRDFETGSSGPLHQVDKSEVRDWATVAQGSVAPTLFLVGAGQSNIASSNAQATGGDLTTDANILYWTGSAFVTWDPATGVGVGAAGYNSILFQTAKEARRRGAGKVFCVNKGEAGEKIDQWTGSGSSSSNYVTLKGLVNGALASSDLIAINKTTVDGFVWGQGESDGGASFVLATYAASFDALKAQLRAETWFPDTTPIVCLEMPSQGAASTVNAFFTDTVPFDADPYVRTALTRGLDDGADDLHWTGAAMNEIGARAYGTMHGFIKPALPVRGVRSGSFFRWRLEHVFGKGIGFSYVAANDQVLIGGASDALGESLAAPSVTFDLDGSWFRIDSYGYALDTFEFLSGAILKSYNGSNFADITHAVNTDPDKKEGTTYWDAANDRLVVSSGTGASAPWRYFAKDGDYTPV